MITEKRLFNDREGLCKQIGTSGIYTITEFQQMFNVSNIYVYKLVKKGKLPPFRGKIGRYSFYTEEDVQAVLASGILNHKLICGVTSKRGNEEALATF